MQPARTDGQVQMWHPPTTLVEWTGTTDYSTCWHWWAQAIAASPIPWDKQAWTIMEFYCSLIKLVNTSVATFFGHWLGLVIMYNYSILPLPDRSQHTCVARQAWCIAKAYEQVHTRHFPTNFLKLACIPAYYLSSCLSKAKRAGISELHGTVTIGKTALGRPQCPWYFIDIRLEHNSSLLLKKVY